MFTVNVTYPDRVRVGVYAINDDVVERLLEMCILLLLDVWSQLYDIINHSSKIERGRHAADCIWDNSRCRG